LAVLLTAFLVAYSYRILGRTPWLRRLGWLRPPWRFWVYAALAGALAAFAVSAIVRVFHVRLGTSPPHTILLASTSAAMLEELLFRGMLFWLLLKLFLRLRFPTILACIVTVLLTACGFAFAHERAGLSLYATIGTGIAFGYMRVASQSTAAAAVMHGAFNLVLSLLAMR
jgi:membrane protease YdiL (CAAX protease family)